MTDGKTDPPAADPQTAMILERINGLEASIKAGHVLLAADINGVIDGTNQRFATLTKAVADVKDKQAEHGRVLAWLKKTAQTLANGLEEFNQDYVKFQQHVFEQFKRTPSLRVMPDHDHHNGNGTNGE